MHHKNVVYDGKSLQDAKGALIMLHGRGADAQDILGLAPLLPLERFALLAPEATNHTWYPYSFMATHGQNEPWLSSALKLIDELVHDVTASGIAPENIYFLGFSQGACLSLEFAARNAARYGGLIAFTGGLIGDQIQRDNYSGNFHGMPAFISTGNPDPHVPLERVEESANIFRNMGARVDFRAYPGRPHTISRDELDRTNQWVFHSG